MQIPAAEQTFRWNGRECSLRFPETGHETSAGISALTSSDTAWSASPTWEGTAPSRSWLWSFSKHGPFVKFWTFFLFFCTSSKKQSVITPVHFGSRFTFFHQLGQILTHCTLSSSLDKLSLFFLQHSNPNRIFHLFSFRESVFSGIFSGSKIIWRRVSYLRLLQLLHVRGAHKS